MAYQPIENYGVVGDLNTVALVGLNGSIDFMCFPDFDSPSIFSALLDDIKGGNFTVAPSFNDVRSKQLYLPDTNVLLTKFLSEEGVGEILDFMPVQEKKGGKVLIRRVTHIRGKGKYVMRCSPRFDYARSAHEVAIFQNEVTFTSKDKPDFSIRLRSNTLLNINEKDAFAEFELCTGEVVDFIFELTETETIPQTNISNYVTDVLNQTINYWKNWVSLSSYSGRWQDIVHRSALTLKLLTSYKYGSIIAAPTFGLPEDIGGTRNWDYRYTWIRDASFTIYAFIKMGYTREASKFMSWVEKKCEDIGHKGYLGLMYAIDGKAELHETELDHLSGYKNSKPVRIGNDAHRQVQLDIYGELMDAVYLFNKFGEPISYDFWKSLSKQMEWLKDNWHLEDEGIWEVRGGKRSFLHSRLMCWVAFDRAIKIADNRSFPYNENWKEVRNEIFLSIYDDFWDEEKQCFVQYKGAKSVDAATLLMPLLRFISPKDPKWLSTLKCIEEELVSDSLVYRYKHLEAASDGLEGEEGTFSICTFWYVECLTKSGQL